MRLLILGIIVLLSAPSAFAQRFLQPVFATTQSQSNIAYGAAPAWDGTNTPLAMDMYQPAGDSVALRPFILFFHGGSFTSGVRNDVVMTTLCTEFAKRGYVTATASYRLGVNLANLPQLNIEFIRAAIRGMQDARAAVRFIRRSVAEQGNPYGIDTNRIYIGGYSAGAIAAIHVAYLNDTSNASVTLRNELRGLGGLEGNSGNAGFSSKVHGVFTMAGAVIDTTLLGTQVPTAIHFHGTTDNVVPFGRGFVQANGFPVTQVDGSALLHARLQNRGSYSELFAFEGVGHDLVSDPSRWNFLVLQTARFFYNLQNNSVSVANQSLPSMRLYPNPAPGWMQLESPSNEPAIVSLVDLSGKMVYSSEIKPTERIYLGEIPTGVYIARIFSQNGMYTQRIILTHER